MSRVSHAFVLSALCLLIAMWLAAPAAAQEGAPDSAASSPEGGEVPTPADTQPNLEWGRLGHIKAPPPPFPVAGAAPGQSGEAAQRPDRRNRPRFALAVHFGVGGDAAALGDSNSLATTYGLNLRFDFPIGSYVALGPMLSGRFWNTSNGETAQVGRSGTFDINVVPRLRYPFTVGKGHLEIYVGVPVGLSLSVLNNRLRVTGITPEQAGIGYNVGVLGGAQWYFGGSVGIMAELGWLRHSLDHDPEVDLSQTVINLGLAILIGGKRAPVPAPGF